MTDGGSSGDERLILAAVQSLFSEEEYPRVVTGDLREDHEIRHSLDAKLVRAEYDPAVIRKLALASADEAEAEVQLSATRLARWDWHGRPQSFEYRYAGPVTLVREGSEWRVSDFYVNGRSVRASRLQVELTRGLNGLRIDVRSARFIGARRISVVISATNGGIGPVRIRSVLVGHDSARGRWKWTPAAVATRELIAGETTLELQAGMPETVPPDGIRLLVLTDMGVVDVRPASAAEMSRPPMLPRLPWWLPDAVAVAMLAAIVGAVANVGGATLILLVAAWMYRGAIATRRGWLLRNSPRPVRTLAGVALVVFLAFASGGAHDIADLDFSAVPFSLLISVLALGAVSGWGFRFLQRRLENRSRSVAAVTRLTPVVSLLGALAVCLGYGIPPPALSVSQVYAEQHRLAQIAVDAITTGDSKQLLQNADPDRKGLIDFEWSFATGTAQRLQLGVVGVFRRTTGKTEYRLVPRAPQTKGTWYLAVTFVQRRGRELISNVELTGKARISLVQPSGSSA